MSPETRTLQRLAVATEARARSLEVQWPHQHVVRWCAGAQVRRCAGAQVRCWQLPAARSTRLQLYTQTVQATALCTQISVPIADPRGSSDAFEWIMHQRRSLRAVQREFGVEGVSELLSRSET